MNRDRPALHAAVALAAAFLPLPAASAEPGVPAALFNPGVPAALFNYDKQASLDRREVGVVKKGAAVVHDLTFAAQPGDKEPTKAYLVVPDGPGPFAGVLWVHWLGEPGTTNRTQFLAEAEALAPQGVVSLLVDAMWSTADWYRKRVLADDRKNSIRQVVAIRRALDLLLAHPKVDKARIGFVGHDYGAMYGMIAAGVEPRARTYVFIAPTQSLSDWAFFSNQPVSKADYLRENADLELTDYLGQVRNGSTLFQFANQDAYVSRTDSLVLLAAAQAPKERRFYEADHALAIPKAAEDRAAWLLEKLAAAR